MPVVCQRNAVNPPKVPRLGRVPSGEEERLVKLRKHVEKTLDVIRTEAADLCNLLETWEQVAQVESATTKAAMTKIFDALQD